MFAFDRIAIQIFQAVPFPKAEGLISRHHPKPEASLCSRRKAWLLSLHRHQFDLKLLQQAMLGAAFGVGPPGIAKSIRRIMAATGEVAESAIEDWQKGRCDEHLGRWVEAWPLDL